MFAIIGIVVVIGCIIGGYLLEHGNLMVLMQPAELLIIGGSAAGTVLIANPLHVLKKLVSGILGVMKGSHYTAVVFLDALKFMNDFFSTARKQGIASLEGDLDAPDKSAIFKKHAGFSKDHHAVHFFCDTMRTVATGGISPHDLDQIMETDIEVMHKVDRLPVTALATMADSLPGLGIVAAVLGIVITMGALGGPPEEIGHKVAAALVGTFLGILLCYGFLAPIAVNMGMEIDAHGEYLQCLRIGITAYLKGAPPMLAVEAARRAIPTHVRPSFQEMDKACRGGGASGKPQGVAA
jgi:chemotaxis protein MotA